MPKKEVQAEQNGHFDLSYRRDAELAEGEWRKLINGLEVLVAPTNTAHFSRIKAQVVAKYGGRRARGLEDLKSKHQTRALCHLIAAGSFLGFRTPNGLPLAINGSDVDDTIEGRMWMLEEFPELREDISAEITALTEEGEELSEATGKN